MPSAKSYFCTFPYYTILLIKPKSYCRRLIFVVSLLYKHTRMLKLDLLTPSEAQLQSKYKGAQEASS